MTILEDTAREMIGAYGIDIDVYKHQGYTSDSQDIWESDAGWSSSAQTVTAMVREQVTDKKLEEVGLTSDAEIMVWTFKDVVGEGDKLAVQGEEWIVDSIKKQHVQGRIYRCYIGAISNEG